MGAYDNMFSNASTFKVEMDEWSVCVLSPSTFVDFLAVQLQDLARSHPEVTRYTRRTRTRDLYICALYLSRGIVLQADWAEQKDGMAIAGAVLHQLATHTLPLCCFATHYSSLTDDYAYHPNIRNMHMGTLMNEEEKEVCAPSFLTFQEV